MFFGQIGGRGASLMLGYFDDQKATEESFNAHGWFMTGDLGWLDADGYLRITGRLKDVIIRGGHNIHPARIEEIVEKVRVELEEKLYEEGEAAAFSLGITDIHPEVLKLLGRLRYRTSYGQNVLVHSLEVAQLARSRPWRSWMCAAENTDALQHVESERAVKPGPRGAGRSRAPLLTRVSSRSVIHPSPSIAQPSPGVRPIRRKWSIGRPPKSRLPAASWHDPPGSVRARTVAGVSYGEAVRSACPFSSEARKPR